MSNVNVKICKIRYSKKQILTLLTPAFQLVAEPKITLERKHFLSKLDYIEAAFLCDMQSWLKKR